MVMIRMLMIGTIDRFLLSKSSYEPVRSLQHKSTDWRSFGRIILRPPWRMSKNLGLMMR